MFYTSGRPKYSVQADPISRLQTSSRFLEEHYLSRLGKGVQLYPPVKSEYVSDNRRTFTQVSRSNTNEPAKRFSLIRFCNLNIDSISSQIVIDSLDLFLNEILGNVSEQEVTRKTVIEHLAAYSNFVQHLLEGMTSRTIQTQEQGEDQQGSIRSSTGSEYIEELESLRRTNPEESSTYKNFNSAMLERRTPSAEYSREASAQSRMMDSRSEVSRVSEQFVGDGGVFMSRFVEEEYGSEIRNVNEQEQSQGSRFHQPSWSGGSQNQELRIQAETLHQDLENMLIQQQQNLQR